MTILSLTFGVAAIAFISYACRKNEKDSALQYDQEKVLYVNPAEKQASTAADLFLGGNVKKVTSVSYQHSLLDVFRSSVEWTAAVAGETLELDEITRTYVLNSDVSLITIPLRINGLVRDYFNVYIQDKRVLITKLSEIRNADGLITYRVQSPRGELYYKFDLNNRNQMGNWKFEKDIPKLFIAPPAASTAREAELCTKKKFYGCMSCLIGDVCGSDWLCSIACGLAVPSCVGGASLVCLVAS